MKNLLYILLFIPGLLLAQAPEGINYQALIRDASGVVVANQNVGIQLSLLQGSASGSAVYKETFSPTTNDFGLVNLQIGAGTPTLGTFSTIDWNNGTYFIETAVDVNGGTSYVVISTTQFMSVPYALYAKNSGLDSAGVQGMIDANPDFDSVGIQFMIDSSINSLYGILNSESHSILYPEGLDDITPLNIFSFFGRSTYTVPQGKTLYILSVNSADFDDSLSINNLPIFSAKSWVNNDNRYFGMIENPIIIAENDVVSLKGTINGFLVSKSNDVQPVTIDLTNTSGSGGQYIVPAGKLFVLFNIHNPYTEILLNGNVVAGSDHNASGNYSVKTLKNSLFFSSGDILSQSSLWSTVKVTLNGYLVDSNYFTSQSSNLSSSGSGSGGSTHYVGELYGGGVVFYVDHTGHHGLIVSLNDLSNNTGIVSSNLVCNSWDGASNTSILINAGFSATSPPGLCDAYSYGGYNDWYLPSISELVCLFNNSFIVNKTLTQQTGSNLFEGGPGWQNGGPPSYISSSCRCNGPSVYSLYYNYLDGIRSTNTTTTTRAIRAF